MPKTMLGVQGLNPWNISIFFVCIGWAFSRKRESLSFSEAPTHIVILLLIYFLVIAAGFFRLMSDQLLLQEWNVTFFGEEKGFASQLSEMMINCFKWVVPGLLLFDGCKSRERAYWGAIAVLLIYFLLAVQVVRWMPLGGLTSGASLEDRSLKILANEIGYHRVNLAMLLAGGFWAIFCFRDLLPNKSHHVYIYVACAVVFLGLALTAGRMGYVTWLVIGGVLSILRWRRLIFLAPIPIFAILILVPSAWERLSSGFGGENVDTNAAMEATMNTSGDEPHLYTITSGRTTAWPLVLDQIIARPWIGHGREAMIRTGVAMGLWSTYGESFPHPHNAYLQWMLDNGAVGFLPVLLFYLLMLKYSFTMFMDRSNSFVSGIGGISFSLLLALLIASMGSQSFYPREGAVGMWCAMGLMLRVYTAKTRGGATFEIDGAEVISESKAEVSPTFRPLWEKTREVKVVSFGKSQP